jgi:hypothetical protein
MATRPVLTTASKLVCPHNGQVTVAGGQRRLTVGGHPVLLVTDVLGATIAGCKNTDASKSQLPCSAVTGITAGTSRTLTVNGVAVLLGNAKGTALGSPTPTATWQVDNVGQSILEAS